MSSNSSPVENQQRSAMIMSMEKTLNNAWFMRRTAAKDSYCTLSSSQYWDFLTYIDVRSRWPKHFFAFSALFLLSCVHFTQSMFVVCHYRMIIFQSGKSYKWRRFTWASSKSSPPNLSCTSVSVGSWPTLWWDLSCAPKPKTSSFVCPLPSLSQPSSLSKVPTGRDQARLSMRSSLSLPLTAPTSESHLESTSLSGGKRPASNSTVMDTLCQRCTNTTGKLRCHQATLTSTPQDTEKKMQCVYAMCVLAEQSLRRRRHQAI